MNHGCQCPSRTRSRGYSHSHTPPGGIGSQRSRRIGAPPPSGVDRAPRTARNRYVAVCTHPARSVPRGVCAPVLPACVTKFVWFLGIHRTARAPHGFPLRARSLRCTSRTSCLVGQPSGFGTPIHLANRFSALRSAHAKSSNCIRVIAPSSVSAHRHRSAPTPATQQTPHLVPSPAPPHPTTLESHRRAARRRGKP